jgi:mRNA-degrading endonuclease YafQ of YafQ-DinJ toxin-antitoxin module
MKTKELIEKLKEYKKDFDGFIPHQMRNDLVDEVIKKLREYDELMKCRVMTVDGKWEKSRQE